MAVTEVVEDRPRVSDCQGDQEQDTVYVKSCAWEPAGGQCAIRLRPLSYDNVIPESRSQSNDSLSAVFESDLPPGFIYHHRYGIGEVEAAAVRQHGQSDTLVFRK